MLTDENYTVTITARENVLWKSFCLFFFLKGCENHYNQIINNLSMEGRNIHAL